MTPRQMTSFFKKVPTDNNEDDITEDYIEAYEKLKRVVEEIVRSYSTSKKP